MNLYFTQTGYILQGGQIILGGNSTITNPVSGTTTINSDLGESGGARTLKFNGAGVSSSTFTVGGNNSFSGQPTVSACTLNFNNLNNAGSPSSFGQGSTNVIVGSSASGTKIQYTGTGGSTDRSFQFGGSAAGGGHTINNNGTGPIAFNNPGSAMLTNTVSGVRSLTLGGSYTGGVNVFAEAFADMPSLNPALTNTAITIAGGQWYLSGTNSHSGTNFIGTSSSVVVLVSNDMAFGASTAPIRFIGSCKIKSTNIDVILSANRTITVTNTLTAKFGNSGTENLYINSYITGQGGVSKVDSSFSQGRVRFACPTNDFQGDFGIDKGNVEFTYLANQGTPSSFGVGVAANYGRITLNNLNSATYLSYVGTNNCATTRPLGWMGGGSSIVLEATNTGTIAYLAADNIRLVGASAQNITLRGSNTGTNTLNQGVNDAGGNSTSLSKTGSGQWILSGANSYSGITIVSGGLLTLKGSSPLGATTNVSLFGATLDFSGVTGGTLSLGAVQTVTLTGNLGTANWQSATNIGNLDISASAGLTVGYSNGIPALRVASGALTLGAAVPLSIIVSNGGTALPGGTYTLIATNAGGSVAGSVTNAVVLSGDVTNTATVSITGGQLVLTVPGGMGTTTISLALTAGSSPSIFGSPLTFTATVTGSGGSATPAGTVTFKNGITILGTGTLSGSGTIATANFTTNGLPAGTNFITAGFAGDINYVGSTNSPALARVVQYNPPQLIGISLGGAGVILTMNGTNGQPYKVLTSTNVANPLSTWTTNATGTLTGSTLYYTNGPATNAQQFYLITSP